MGPGLRLGALPALARPVVVPLDDLTMPGKAFPFTADGVTLPSAATPNQPVRMNGMVVRTSKGDNSPERFKAVCLKCPHEGCDVEFIGDSSRVPEEVTTAIGKVSAPVYICPCHNSTFKIDDGSKLVRSGASRAVALPRHRRQRDRCRNRRGRRGCAPLV